MLSGCMVFFRPELLGCQCFTDPTFAAHLDRVQVVGCRSATPLRIPALFTLLYPANGGNHISFELVKNHADLIRRYGKLYLKLPASITTPKCEAYLKQCAFQSGHKLCIHNVPSMPTPVTNTFPLLPKG